MDGWDRRGKATRRYFHIKSHKTPLPRPSQPQIKSSSCRDSLTLIKRDIKVASLAPSSVAELNNFKSNLAKFLAEQQPVSRAGPETRKRHSSTSERRMQPGQAQQRPSLNQKSLFLKRRARQKLAKTKNMKEYLTTLALKGKHRLSEALRSFATQQQSQQSEASSPAALFLQMQPLQTESEWKKEQQENEMPQKVPIHHTQHHYFSRMRVKTQQSVMQSSLLKQRPSQTAVSVDKPLRPETPNAVVSETPHSIKKQSVVPYPRSPRSPKKDFRSITGLGRLESQNRMWCKIQTKSLNYPKKEDEITPWDRIQGSDLSVLI